MTRLVMVRVVIWAISVLTLNVSYGRYIVQIKDFLCGCDYCVTVSPSEPLFIGDHLLRCHSWREPTLKTMKIMEANKQHHGQHISETLPSLPSVKDLPLVKKIVEHELEPPVETETIEHVWAHSEQHGWVYMSSRQPSDWIYREDVGWVWLIEPESQHMYSHDHGWFYNIKHMNRRYFYWYDRKMWLFIGDFFWKK